MDLGLRGLRAVVTGGTRGIGLKIAETLAAEGVNVAICSRNASEAAAVAQSLTVHGVTTMGRGVDMRDGPAIAGWVNEAAVALDGLDIIVSTSVHWRSAMMKRAGRAVTKSTLWERSAL